MYLMYDHQYNSYSQLHEGKIREEYPNPNGEFMGFLKDNEMGVADDRDDDVDD